MSQSSASGSVSGPEQPEQPAPYGSGSPSAAPDQTSPAAGQTSGFTPRKVRVHQAGSDGP